MNSRSILTRLYPQQQIAAGKRRALQLRPTEWLGRNAWKIAAGVLLVGGWVASHIYYYNLFVDMESDVQAAWANVEVQQQRRAHVQRNLLALMRKYGAHERELFSLVTKLRTRQRIAGREASPNARRSSVGAASGAPAAVERLPGDSASTGGSLPAIEFMAEQYPQLRLSENFQQMAAALVDTENQIATAIQAYNSAVNIYGTELVSFPEVIFARVYGFKEYSFFTGNRRDLRFEAIR